MAGKFASADYTGLKDVADFPKSRQRKKNRSGLHHTDCAGNLIYVLCTEAKNRKILRSFAFLEILLI